MTIVSISRQSSRSAPKATKEELQYRSEQNNKRLKAALLAVNAEDADDQSSATYHHYEILVMPSNENVVLQQEKVPVQIRKEVKCEY